MRHPNQHEFILISCTDGWIEVRCVYAGPANIFCPQHTWRDTVTLHRVAQWERANKDLKD